MRVNLTHTLIRGSVWFGVAIVTITCTVILTSVLDNCSDARGDTIPSENDQAKRISPEQERKAILTEVNREPRLPEEIREPSRVPIIAKQIESLQPWYENHRIQAMDLAVEIDQAAKEYNFDPFLLIALGMRESSLLAGRTGTRGEQGHFQIIPHGAASRQCGPEGDARDAACWLAKCRDWCPGSTDRWVAAYGLSYCPSEQDARNMPVVRRFRKIYDEIRQDS